MIKFILCLIGLVVAPIAAWYDYVAEDYFLVAVDIFIAIIAGEWLLRGLKS